MAYTGEQYLSVKRNTAGGCVLTWAEADQLGEMMEQAAAQIRELTELRAIVASKEKAHES